MYTINTLLTFIIYLCYGSYDQLVVIHPYEP